MSTVDYRHSHIRSFVRHESRMTRAQEKALATLWDQYGISLDGDLLDAQELFERKAPIILEIGFGMGQSLITMAESNPDKDFIGIEVYRPGIGALLVALNSKQINNVRVCRGDAIDILRQKIAPLSLDKIQVFFPDPWQKTRHLLCLNIR